MTEATRKAVSLYMDLTRKDEAVCKNCGQKITRWTLPQMGVFKDEEAWYHVCKNPEGLKHLSIHSANDPELGQETCYHAEPKETPK